MFQRKNKENVKKVVFEENGQGILPKTDKLFM